MSEVILVVLRRPERVVTLLNAAKHLAELTGAAHLNVLAVREPIQVTALAAEELMNETDAVVDARKREQERLAALKAAFDRWDAEAGAAGAAAATARWFEVEGSAATIIGEKGSRADVIVAGQPAEDDRLARQAFRAALFGTDRPVLMMPPGATAVFGHSVALAWRDDKQAARAVIPALRCLADAGQVHVLMGVREDAARPAMPRILLEHGIHADLHVLPIGSGPFGQTLLDKAHAVGADVLVMGAYTHSPLRELVLGGVTRYMLAHADLPVFMRH